MIPAGVAEGGSGKRTGQLERRCGADHTSVALDSTAGSDVGGAFFYGGKLDLKGLLPHHGRAPEDPSSRSWHQQTALLRWTLSSWSFYLRTGSRTGIPKHLGNQDR